MLTALPSQQPTVVAVHAKARIGLIDRIGEQQVAAFTGPLGTGLSQYIARLGRETQNPLTGVPAAHQASQKIGHRLPAGGELKG